jgi:hypothetical protein
VSDLDLVLFWEELIAGNEKLLSFKAFHQKYGSSFLSSLRIERKTLVSTPSTFIVSHEPSSGLEEDRWQFQAIHNSIIKVISLRDNSTMEIPFEATLPGLRRGSSRRKMDVSQEFDRVVVKSFSGADRFFGVSRDQYGQDLINWERKVIDRLSNLCIFRRFDLSANGTSHLAFYGKELYAATDIMLTIKGVSDENAKLLTLWLNSSLNILQVLFERIETRGSYIETPVFVCERLLVPDFEQITPEIKTKLLGLFDSLREVEFPSIIEQLNSYNALRIQIDMAFLNALGFPRADLRERVRKLQSQLLNEILKLKDLMRG